MHSSNAPGCHKVGPCRASSGDVDPYGDVVGAAPPAPELGVYLLARLRLRVLLSLAGGVS